MEPQPPTRTSDLARGGSLAVMVIDLALLAGLVMGTLRVRASFSGIFEDFEVELPLLTQWLLSVPGWAIILGALLLAAAVGLKELLVRDARVSLLVNLAALVALLALGALLVMALVLPLVTLIDKLS